MSRIEKQNSGYTIAYGLDHMAGLFIQIFDKSLKGEEAEEPVVDLDKWNHPDLTVEKIVFLAEDYGFDLSAELSEGVIE